MKKNHSLLLVGALFVVGMLVLDLGSAFSFFPFLGNKGPTIAQNVAKVPAMPVQKPIENPNMGKEDTVTVRSVDHVLQRSYSIIEKLEITLLGLGFDTDGTKIATIQVGKVRPVKLRLNEPVAIYNGEDGYKITAEYAGDEKGGAKIFFRGKDKDNKDVQVHFLIPSNNYAYMLFDNGIGFRYKGPYDYDDHKWTAIFRGVEYSNLKDRNSVHVVEDGDEVYRVETDPQSGEGSMEINVRGKDTPLIKVIGVSESIGRYRDNLGGSYVFLTYFGQDTTPLVLSQVPPFNKVIIPLKAVRVHVDRKRKYDAARVKYNYKYDIIYRLFSFEKGFTSPRKVTSLDKFESSDILSTDWFKGYNLKAEYEGDETKLFSKKSVRRNLRTVVLSAKHFKNYYNIVGITGVDTNCAEACGAAGYGICQKGLKFNFNFEKSVKGREIDCRDNIVGGKEYELAFCFCGN